MSNPGHRSRRPNRRRPSLIILGCILLLTAPFASFQQTAGQGADIGAWELVSNGDGPFARWDHTIAADEAGGGLLLFGGRDGNGDAFGDTWLFDTAARTWRNLEGTDPPARFGQAVAVDQEARVLYLFGGQAGSTFYDDTWRFDFETETWEQIGTSTGPSARYGNSAVLDGDGNLVISHGFTFDGRFDDTWSLNLESGAWTNVSPDVGAVRPLPRCLHEAIWDAERGRMLLFGGCASGFGPCPLGDLWAFDPDTRGWTELTPSNSPAPRMNAALVLDPDGDGAILFAGNLGGGYTFDAWTLDIEEDAATWVGYPLGSDVPAARSSLDVATLGERVYLFGGIGDAGVFADLWTTSIE